jgi:uncharacterized protein
MDELQFEWDGEKASIDLIKHRVSFLTAAAIFANETMERIDDREDYGELRHIALGRVDLDVYRGRLRAARGVADQDHKCAKGKQK